MTKKKNESIPLILYPLAIVFTILFIAFTLLTFGIFLPDENEKKISKQNNGKSSEEERLRISIARKQNRLNTVLDRVRELDKIKQQITKKEKRILFVVRLIIAGSLILVNLLFLSGFFENGNTDFSTISFYPIKDTVDTIANFNACILLLYSIPAYILYGTVGKFTTAMKTKTTQILRKKHIPTLSELQALKEEVTQLKRDIDYLNTQLLK